MVLFAADARFKASFCFRASAFQLLALTRWPELQQERCESLELVSSSLLAVGFCAAHHQTSSGKFRTEQLVLASCPHVSSQHKLFSFRRCRGQSSKPSGRMTLVVDTRNRNQSAMRRPVGPHFSRCRPPLAWPLCALLALLRTCSGCRGTLWGVERR